MIIKGDEKNRGYWKIGIVTELHVGPDGIVRSATLRAGKSYLERTIPNLYPLELNCDRDREPAVVDRGEDDGGATVVMTQPSRDAAAVAALRIRDGADEEVMCE